MDPRTEILGFEDDVVIDYAINQLEETNHPDPKAVQINRIFECEGN